MCKVSVIVPIYNVEKYLSECIDSIIAQTHKDLEIILVDDGSTDNSPRICDEYAKKDSRIIVIHKQNGGAASARNSALDIMTGEYCCFVDSDDLINIHFVECLLDACLNSDSEISYCGYSTFHKSENVNIDSIPDGEKNVVVFENTAGLENYFSGWIYPMMCNKLCKKTCFEKVRFLPIKVAEDMSVTFELLFSNYKICGLKGYPLYYYRNTPNSVMKSNVDHSAVDELTVRSDIYLRLCEYPNLNIMKKKFSDNTRNVFIDTVIRIRFSDKSIKPLIKEIKKCRDKLYQEMFLPEAEKFSEKFDCFIMKLSLRMYRIYKLVQAKVFKIQIYK